MLLIHRAGDHLQSPRREGSLSVGSARRGPDHGAQSGGGRRHSRRRQAPPRPARISPSGRRLPGHPRHRGRRTPCARHRHARLHLLSIDDLRVYDRALSTAEVGQLAGNIVQIAGKSLLPSSRIHVDAAKFAAWHNSVQRNHETDGQNEWMITTSVADAVSYQRVESSKSDTAIVPEKPFTPRSNLGSQVKSQAMATDLIDQVLANLDDSNVIDELLIDELTRALMHD